MPHKLPHKMPHTVRSYLRHRRGHYYFRFRTPAHVRLVFPSYSREILYSLRTDSKRIAEAIIAPKLALIDALQRTFEVEQVAYLYKQLASPFQLPPVVEAQKPQSVRPETPRLSAVWREFVEWKQWAPKAQSSNQRIFDSILFILGDVPVGDITKSHLKAALTVIAEMPRRNLKAYKNLSLVEISQIDVPFDDRVSGKYVKDHLKVLQSFFSRYLVQERGLLSVAPTEALRWEYESVRFACLGASAIRDILEKSDAGPEWFKWFIRLAVYSGARRGELAKLTVHDFKKDADTGRHYFVIRTGKTQAATRRVPLHKSLIFAGLLKFLKSSSSVIFPEVADNLNKVTDKFGALVDEPINEVGERVVLHSLRHTFITNARSAGVQSVLVQQVVGHEKSGAGMTDRYTHEFPLSAVLCVVDAVDFS